MDSSLRFPVIEVIATGNELLDGTISDTNTQRLALALRPLGLKIQRSAVVNDDALEISRALVAAASRSDIVIVSGGLGPTSDDLTLEVACKTFGSTMLSDARARANVMKRVRRLKRKFNPGHLKQCLIPKGSRALSNDEGTAPGVQWNVGDRHLFFLPGVPREFDFILNRHLLPFFKQWKQASAKYLFILKVYGVPESELNEFMKQCKLPRGVALGFRTRLPENHVKLQVEAKSEGEARRMIVPIVSRLKRKYGSRFFSMGDESFEESIVKKLLKDKKQIALAESCTGGLATSMLTKVSGASAVLNRSFIVYSNQSKMDLLGVSEETLKKFGAVSKETAVEMAVGALRRAKVDKAVAITGIAGPSGGTKKKPVGTVWIATATSKGVKTSLLQLRFGQRELIQTYSAYEALKMLSEA